MTAKIAYRIDYWPRQAFGIFQIDGDIFQPSSAGVSTKEVTLTPRVFWYRKLTLKNQDQVLVANGHPLQQGETYRRFFLFPSLNPWALLTTRYEITNQGNLGDGKTIYVCGDVKESFLPSPIGLVIFIIIGWSFERESSGTSLRTRNNNHDRALLVALAVGVILGGGSGGIMGWDVGKLLGMIIGAITGALFGAFFVPVNVLSMIEEANANPKVLAIPPMIGAAGMVFFGLLNLQGPPLGDLFLLAALGAFLGLLVSVFIRFTGFINT
jgi:hypothetical protein